MTKVTTDASSNAAPVTQNRAAFIVATIAAVFMTVTEALGTGVVTFWTRLLYWVIVMETGAIIGIGVTSGVQAWGRMRRHAIAEVAVVAVLIALPLTLGVIGAGMIILGMEPPSLRGILRNFLLVAFVSAIITAIVNVVRRSRDAAAVTIMTDAAVPPAAVPPAAVPTAQDVARFRARLPLHLQSVRIVALVSEDHYLRVHTENGSTMILMRLSDAIAELESEDGAQTHRSWWVSRDAIAKSVRSDGKAVLTLVDGTEAPVSRTYYRAIQARGWFA